MLETLLTKIGLPVLINVVAEALQRIQSPVTQSAADALKQVDKALKSGHLSADEMRHAEKMAAMKIRQNTENLAEINKTIRSEIISEDKYVRRMRPTFGYLMAITWAAQMLGVAYVLIFDTGRAGTVIHAMASLSAIWAVGLSVLGIYVYKRSEDKKLTGQPEVIFWNDRKAK